MANDTLASFAASINSNPASTAWMTSLISEQLTDNNE
jgi:hypothetical protein